MDRARLFIISIIACISLYSCTITQSARTIQIEVMKPGIFDIPGDLTVAVIKRDLFRSDTCSFYYYNGYYRFGDTLNTANNSAKYQNIKEADKNARIKYRDLSTSCLNELANYLEEEKYFQKVINYGDSLNSYFEEPGRIKNSEELFQLTKSDICIFLDFFHLKTTYNLYFSNPFETKASLIWNIAFKNDSLTYLYNHADTLFYDHEQIQPYSNYPDKILQNLLYNSGKYLGRTFGAKLIPSWNQSDRMYYKSGNIEMLQAEKFALDHNWLKAAEIWKRQTKNSNPKIAAKACYNMALTCEMEGKPELAMSWLVKSYSGLKHEDTNHKANCQRYINVLALRKLEIARLEKQTR